METLPLDDVVLVILSRGPGASGDVQRRHGQIFGAGAGVDAARIRTTARRLQRARHIEQVDVVLRHRNVPTPVFGLTAAGRTRQQQWLPDIPRDADLDDIYARGTLAVEAADQETFDAFVTNARTVAQSRLQDLTAADPGSTPAAAARLTFQQELTRALLMWLLRLPLHRATDGG